MWENIVERGRTQMAIWRMRVACWIPKATDKHARCVILTAQTHLTLTLPVLFKILQAVPVVTVEISCTFCTCSVLICPLYPFLLHFTWSVFAPGLPRDRHSKPTSRQYVLSFQNGTLVSLRTVPRRFKAPPSLR